MRVNRRRIIWDALGDQQLPVDETHQNMTFMSKEDIGSLASTRQAMLLMEKAGTLEALRIPGQRQVLYRRKKGAEAPPGNTAAFEALRTQDKTGMQLYAEFEEAMLNMMDKLEAFKKYILTDDLVEELRHLRTLQATVQKGLDIHKS